MILIAFCHSEALIDPPDESDSKEKIARKPLEPNTPFSGGVGDDKHGKLPSPFSKSCRIQLFWVVCRRVRKVPAKISSGSPGARFQKSENVIREIAFENRVGSRSRFCCVLGLFWNPGFPDPPPTAVFGKSQLLQLLCGNIGELQIIIRETIQKRVFAVPMR